jgi:hypothetical protein
MHMAVGLRWVGTIGLRSRRCICLEHFLDIFVRGLFFGACVCGIDGLARSMICIFRESDDRLMEDNENPHCRSDWPRGHCRMT